jgi:hypothetical protein
MCNCPEKTSDFYIMLLHDFYIFLHVFQTILHVVTICTMVLPVLAYFKSRMSALPSGSELFWCKLWDHAIAWGSSRIEQSQAESTWNQAGQHRSTVQAVSPPFPIFPSIPSTSSGPKSLNRMAEQRQLLTGCVPEWRYTICKELQSYVSHQNMSHQTSHFTHFAGLLPILQWSFFQRNAWRIERNLRRPRLVQRFVCSISYVKRHCDIAKQTKGSISRLLFHPGLSVLWAVLFIARDMQGHWLCFAGLGFSMFLLDSSDCRSVPCRVLSFEFCALPLSRSVACSKAQRSICTAGKTKSCDHLTMCTYQTREQLKQSPISGIMGIQLVTDDQTNQPLSVDRVKTYKTPPARVLSQHNLQVSCLSVRLM